MEPTADHALPPEADMPEAAPAPQELRARRRTAARLDFAALDGGLYNSALASDSGGDSEDEPQRKGSKRQRRGAKQTQEDLREAEVAFGVGFMPYTMSEEELAWPDLADEDLDEHAYCLIRNHVLAKWRANPLKPLSEEEARAAIIERHRKLALIAHRFLARHGFINFGLAALPPAAGPSPNKGSVLILGAGLAGLAAARQLMSFGHQVAIVEARRRPGGRVHTTLLARDGAPQVHGVGELGGSVITGVDGNPLAVVAAQLGAALHTIRDVCPLYDLGGQPVPGEVDEKVFAQFNQLLDSCGEFREGVGATADVISLGRAMALLSTDKGVGAAEAERALLNWHMANLEYANAAHLDSLSLGSWDQDDEHEMRGAHCLLPGGNGRLVGALAAGVPIFYGCRVGCVEHGPGGVALRCSEGWDGEGDAPARERVFRADAVLVTLPLGVLKRNGVAFAPPLPPKKQAAIAALGFGTLNKCVMLFDAPFWDPQQLDTFGRVAASTDERGEFFLFYSYAGGLSGPSPVLVGLVAGVAASAFEERLADAALTRCLAVLRSIFGADRVPQPASFRCTAWEGDPLAYGSYSHVAVGASGAAYDAMAAPLPGGQVFFAGEATTKMHPATMHGAFFSGLREAARITATLPQRRRAGVSAAAPSPVDGAALARAATASARFAAHLARQLAVVFAKPIWEFGSFALVIGPGTPSPDAPTLVRVDVAGKSKQPLPMYLNLRLADALLLRDCPGDDDARLKLLLTLPGGALLSRRGLPAAAVELVAALAETMGVPPLAPEAEEA